jgi:hypothetical protein
MEHIEPAEDFLPLNGMSQDDVKTACALFEASMRWAVDGKDLIHKGLRLSIVVAALRPDLTAGLKIDRNAARVFKRANAGANGSFQLTGRAFGPIFEWLRRGNRVSELGERVTVLFYVLRPDLLDEPATLAQLGKVSNKTRQAKDKLANEIRDTFAGLKSRTMRADITRARCRAAHEKPGG